MGTTEGVELLAELPHWAVMSGPRRAHVSRVAELMDEWAAELELDESERADWHAAALLHDALRDADPAALREALGEPFNRLSDGMLHGPVAAERLEREGATDRVGRAIRYHTTGHPSFDRLGEALYMADFLEPERPYATEARARLRGRLPGEWNDVLGEVVAMRIGHQLDSGRPIVRWTWTWWNHLAGADEDGWVG